MKDKYVILIDIDDTLVERGKFYVSKKVVKSLIKAKNKGHILSVVTGRGLYSAMAINGYEIFNYISCLMGSLILNVQTKTISRDKNTINSQYVKPLIDYFIKNNKPWTYKDYKQDKTSCPNEIDRFNAKLISIEEIEEDIKNDNVFQLLASSELITQDIKKTYSELNFIEMPGDYYDIVKKGQSKATVVEYFKEKFPNYKMVGIGDSDNDIPMLENCDISIAMGNSPDKIKHIATYTTKSVKEDGVSYAIENILKIEWITNQDCLS